MENQRDLCTECRRETNYTLKKIKINQTIREKEYTFEITDAFCNKCGGKMNRVCCGAVCSFWAIIH